MSKIVETSGFIEESELIGIRFWAQHYMWRVPRLEVFEYIGREVITTEDGKKRELMYFRSRSEPTVVRKTWKDLANFGNGFRPFLLNTKKIWAVWEQEVESKSEGDS